MAHLQEIQQILGDPSLKFKEPKHACWLSHGKAVTAVRRCLPSLITTLEQEAVNNLTATGLVKTVMTYEFVACTYLLSDILPSLNRLSLIFQRKDLDFLIIHSTISFLESLKTNDGPMMNQKHLKRNVMPSTSILLGRKQKISKEWSLSPTLTVYVKSRFPHLDILDAFQIFNPELLPSSESEVLLDHGHGQLQIRCKINFS